MKKIILIVLTMIMIEGLTACNSGGVTQEEYDRIVTELNNLKNTENDLDKVSKEDYDSVIEELNNLKNDYNSLDNITQNSYKKIPDVMVVRIPKFRAVTSGYKNYGEVFNLMSWAWQEENKHFFKDIIFDCNDFLKKRNGKFEYIMAINDGVTESDTAPYEITEFEGGLYALAVSIDDDDESIQKVEDKILRWIESTNFEYDESRDIMGHMAYCDDDIVEGLDYEQLQRYVPIKLKD